MKTEAEIRVVHLHVKKHQRLWETTRKKPEKGKQQILSRALKENQLY